MVAGRAWEREEKGRMYIATACSSRAAVELLPWRHVYVAGYQIKDGTHTRKAWGITLCPNRYLGNSEPQSRPLLELGLWIGVDAVQKNHRPVQILWDHSGI